MHNSGVRKADIKVVRSLARKMKKVDSKVGRTYLNLEQKGFLAGWVK